MNTIQHEGRTFEYDPATLKDLVYVQVQPHRGKRSAYVEYIDLLEKQLHSYWHFEYRGDHDSEWREITDALDSGDLIPALAYDSQWASVKPLAEMDDDWLAQIMWKCEWLGLFIDVTDED